MRLFLFVLCLIPVVLAAPDRRFLEFLFGANAFDLSTLKCDVQLIIDVVGTDPTEAACESECHKIIQEGHVLNYGCPLVCKGMQTLAQQLHLVPETLDPSASPCASSGK